ncbi:hypothetical protein HAX54_019759, partial [Datura stramonium]|nr:hypothetical protein [Datura stramonium]
IARKWNSKELKLPEKNWPRMSSNIRTAEGLHTQTHVDGDPHVHWCRERRDAQIGWRKERRAPYSNGVKYGLLFDYEFLIKEGLIGQNSTIE